MVADLTPRTLWRKEDVGSNRTSKNELRALFPDSESFDTPKPTKLIDRMLRLATTSDEGDLVLDFFAGSGTTGHAVYSANLEDGGSRRFILVQLPEPLETASTKLSTIADVTRERLRRAGAALRESSASYKGDLGFRAFRLDASNVRPWSAERDNLAKSLFDHLDHIDGKRSDEDVLYELLLKLGLDLCVPILTQTIAGKTVHAIGGGVLMTCLEKTITAADAEPLALGIAAWRKALDPAGDVTCVFRDSAFENDVAKTNLAAILEQHGIAKVRSL